MEKYIKVIKTTISVSIGFLGGVYGSLDTSLKILLLMMVIDLIAGWRIGKRGLSNKTDNGGFSSSEMKIGLEKKFFTIIYVTIGYLMDGLLSLNFLGEAFVWFYIAYEIISISENATILGVVKVPLLNRVVDLLIKVADKEIE